MYFVWQFIPFQNWTCFECNSANLFLPIMGKLLVLITNEITTRWHNCIQDHQISCVAWNCRSLRALLALRIITHVTPLLTLRLLTPYCDNCIHDRYKISFHLCDTQLVGEISLPMLPLHEFKSTMKMFTFSLLTLHKTTSNTAGNVYHYQSRYIKVTCAFLVINI